MTKYNYKKDLEKLAPAIQQASPATSTAVMSFVKTWVLPMLPSIVTALLVRASPKTKALLRETRDVLNSADLGEDD